MTVYHVVSGSNSGHCCFEASVVSPDRPQRRNDGSPATNPDGVPHLESICECFERRDADTICLVLNEAESPRPQPQDSSQAARVALQAWQAAWKLQGEAKVHAMVNASKLTDEALEGIP